MSSLRSGHGYIHIQAFLLSSNDKRRLPPAFAAQIGVRFLSVRRISNNLLHYIRKNLAVSTSDLYVTTQGSTASVVQHGPVYLLQQ
jgi:hypothetical protein